MFSDVVLFDASCDEGQLGIHLVECGARLDPAENLELPPVAGEHVRIGPHREPQVGSEQHCLPRHDTDDGIGIVVHGYRLAQDFGIVGIQVGPHPMADDRDAFPLPHFVIEEPPAEGRLHAHSGKGVAPPEGGEHAFGPVAGHDVPVTHVERHDVFQQRRFAAHVGVLRRRMHLEEPEVGLTRPWEGRPDANQPIHGRVGERAEHCGVDDRVDDGG